MNLTRHAWRESKRLWLRRSATSSRKFRPSVGSPSYKQTPKSHTPKVTISMASSLTGFSYPCGGLLGAGGFSQETRFGTIKSNNYFNHSRSEVDPGTVIGTLNTNTNLIVSQLEDQFKIGTDHTFRAGFEYRHKEGKVKIHR